MDLETLIQFDKQMLLAANGSDSLYLDGLVMTLTTAATWIPLYISLFYLVLKNNENIQQILLIIASVGLCVSLAGMVDDTLVKPTVARWRPAHDPEIGMMVDVVNGYRGGHYGFFSAHAANTFSVAMFFCLLVRSHSLSLVLIFWSLVNCWTRIYLGVHYPGDILCGLIWGFVVASSVYFFIYKLIYKRLSTGMHFISTQYTSSGYLLSDIDVVISVLVFSFIYALINACFIL